MVGDRTQRCGNKKTHIKEGSDRNVSHSRYQPCDECSRLREAQECVRWQATDPEWRIGFTGGSSKRRQADDLRFSDAGVVDDKRQSPYDLADTLQDVAGLETDQTDFLAQRNETHLIRLLADGHKGFAHGLVVGQRGVQAIFRIDVGACEPMV